MTLSEKKANKYREAILKYDLFQLGTVIAPFIVNVGEPGSGLPLVIFGVLMVGSSLPLFFTPETKGAPLLQCHRDMRLHSCRETSLIGKFWRKLNVSSQLKKSTTSNWCKMATKFHLSIYLSHYFIQEIFKLRKTNKMSVKFDIFAVQLGPLQSLVRIYLARWDIRPYVECKVSLKCLLEHFLSGPARSEGYWEGIK